VSARALPSSSAPLQKEPIQLNNIDLEGAKILVHIFTEHNVVASYMPCDSGHEVIFAIM
jgi:hypothetical protein